MAAQAKPTILAVDDDAIVLKIVAAVLGDEYEIVPFTTGQAVLDHLVLHDADLVLLDCEMPGMSGLDVLRRMQADERLCEIPVIILTGTENDDCEAEALELGAVDYIQKPVRGRPLHTRVRFQIELQNHNKRLESMVEEKIRSLNLTYTKLRMREDVTLNLLARVTDMRDHETGAHIERTTAIVKILVDDIVDHPAPEYILTPYQGDDVVKSAKLHDLGKIALPDYVLLKPGRLTDEEFGIIKLHPVHGERLLSEFIRQMDDSFLNTARDIAYGHHEKWDGSGYPLGLSGQTIPLAARIVAVADVYDALTSVRPYKQAFDHERAVEIILESRGTHFDPHLVTVFLRHAGEIARAVDVVEQEAVAV